MIVEGDIVMMEGVMERRCVGPYWSVGVRIENVALLFRSPY